MERDQVWEQLIKQGVTKAVIGFSGGGDEGGADSWTFYNGDKELSDSKDFLENDDGDDFVDALEAPIYQEYDFNGDPYVSDGECTWDVASRTVRLTGNRTIETYESFDDIV